MKRQYHSILKLTERIKVKGLTNDYNFVIDNLHKLVKRRKKRADIHIALDFRVDEEERRKFFKNEFNYKHFCLTLNY